MSGVPGVRRLPRGSPGRYAPGEGSGRRRPPGCRMPEAGRQDHFTLRYEDGHR